MCRVASPWRGATVAEIASVLRICRKNRQFGREAAVIHLEHCLDHLSDIFAAEFRGILVFLSVSGSRGEARQYLAWIHQKHADVILTKLGTPAFRNAAKSKFARVICRSVGSPAQAGCGTDINNVAPVLLDEMFRGFTAHEHRSCDIGRKDGIKAPPVHIDELLENAGACI